jgi:formate dehydrogenase subunit gamma
VRLCRAEACRARGAEALGSRAEEALGCRGGETSADGFFTLEPVYCLGHCACGPAVMIDGEAHARVTPERFDALIAALRSAP